MKSDAAASFICGSLTMPRRESRRSLQVEEERRVEEEKKKYRHRVCSFSTCSPHKFRTPLSE